MTMGGTFPMLADVGICRSSPTIWTAFKA